MDLLQVLTSACGPSRKRSVALRKRRSAARPANAAASGAHHGHGSKPAIAVSRPFASSAVSTARPSFVSQSCPASRSMRPLTITVMPVMPAWSPCRWRTADPLQGPSRRQRFVRRIPRARIAKRGPRGRGSLTRLPSPGRPWCAAASPLRNLRIGGRPICGKAKPRFSSFTARFPNYWSASAISTAGRSPVVWGRLSSRRGRDDPTTPRDGPPALRHVFLHCVIFATPLRCIIPPGAGRCRHGMDCNCINYR